MHDYYEILQVSPRADQEVIKAAYGRLAIKHHPDRNPNDPTAERKMKLLNEAKDILLDPLNRKAYDERLAGGRRDDENKSKHAEETRRHDEDEQNRRQEAEKRRRKEAEADLRSCKEAKSAAETIEPEDSTGFVSEPSSAWHRDPVWRTLGIVLTVTVVIFLTAVFVTRAPVVIPIAKRPAVVQPAQLATPATISQPIPPTTIESQPKPTKSNDIAIIGQDLPPEMDLLKAAAHVTRGLEFQKKSELDKAIADYSEAIRYSPTMSAAYLGRGFSRLSNKL